MGRDLSPLIIQQTTPSPLDGSINASTVQAVRITLKNGAILQVANAAITVSSLNDFGVSLAIAPTACVSDVRGVPNVRFSEGKAPDGGDLLLQNLTNLYTPLIGATARVFDGADVVVYDCFKKADGTYEGDVIFVGKVRDARGDPDNARLTLIADYAQRTALVANRPLTQRCLATFGDDRCGYPAQPGQVCSHIYDDKAAGCAFYDWQEFFWGAPAADFADPATSGDDVLSELDRRRDGGWDSGGGFPRPGHRLDVDWQQPLI
jgi:hypothetical protein